MGEHRASRRKLVKQVFCIVRTPFLKKLIVIGVGAAFLVAIDRLKRQVFAAFEIGSSTVADQLREIESQGMILPSVNGTPSSNDDTDDAMPCFDDGSPLFICGKDRWDRPTLVARPSVHHAQTVQESYSAAFHCLDTVRTCIDWLPKGQDQLIVIYDLAEAGPSNFDMAFSRVLVRGLANFPNRLAKVVVVNIRWSIFSELAWRAIKMLLQVETREKVAFCGIAPFDEHHPLLHYVDASHPYIRRLQKSG